MSSDEIIETSFEDDDETTVSEISFEDEEEQNDNPPSPVEVSLEDEDVEQQPVVTTQPVEESFEDDDEEQLVTVTQPVEVSFEDEEDSQPVATTQPVELSFEDEEDEEPEEISFEDFDESELDERERQLSLNPEETYVEDKEVNAVKDDNKEKICSNAHREYSTLDDCLALYKKYYYENDSKIRSYFKNRVVVELQDQDTFSNDILVSLPTITDTRIPKYVDDFIQRHLNDHKRHKVEDYVYENYPDLRDTPEYDLKVESYMSRYSDEDVLNVNLLEFYPSLIQEFELPESAKHVDFNTLCDMCSGADMIAVSCLINRRLEQLMDRNECMSKNIDRIEQLLNSMFDNILISPPANSNKIALVEKVYLETNTYVCGFCGEEHKMDRPFFQLCILPYHQRAQIDDKRLPCIQANVCPTCGKYNMLSDYENAILNYYTLKGTKPVNIFCDKLRVFSSLVSIDRYIPSWDDMTKYIPDVFELSKNEEVVDTDNSITEDHYKEFFKAIDAYLDSWKYYKEGDLSGLSIQCDTKEDIIEYENNIQDSSVTSTKSTDGDDSEFCNSTYDPKFANLFSYTEDFQITDEVLKNSNILAKCVSLMLSKDFESYKKNALYSLIDFLNSSPSLAQMLQYNSQFLAHSRACYCDIFDVHEDYPNLVPGLCELYNLNVNDYVSSKSDEDGEEGKIVYDINRLKEDIGEDRKPRLLEFIMSIEDKKDRSIVLASAMLNLGIVDPSITLKDKDNIEYVDLSRMDRVEELFFELEERIAKQFGELKQQKSKISSIGDFAYFFSFVQIRSNIRIRNLEDYLHNKDLVRFLDFTSNMMIVRELSEGYYDTFCYLEQSKDNEMKSKNTTKMYSKTNKCSLITSNSLKDLVNAVKKKGKDKQKIVANRILDALTTYNRVDYDTHSMLFNRLYLYFPFMNSFKPDDLLPYVRLQKHYLNGDEFKVINDIFTILHPNGIVEMGLDTYSETAFCSKYNYYPFYSLNFIYKYKQLAENFVLAHGSTGRDRLYYYLDSQFSREEIDKEYLDSYDTQSFEFIPKRLPNENLADYLERYSRLSKQEVISSEDCLALDKKYMRELSLDAIQFSSCGLAYMGIVNVDYYEKYMFLSDLMYLACFGVQDEVFTILNIDKSVALRFCDSVKSDIDFDVNLDRAYKQIRKQTYLENIVYLNVDAIDIMSDADTTLDKKLSGLKSLENYATLFSHLQPKVREEVEY